MRGGKSKPIKFFSKSNAENELELLEKDNAKIITYKSPEYQNYYLKFMILKFMIHC
nr:hypothetical protein [Rickettsia rickettsii]